MEKELERVKKYETTFNQEYATDHNEYYNSVELALRKIRSHIAPLKTVLRKTCPRHHPNKNVCQRFNIASKSIYNESMLGITYYQNDIFGISNYPDEVMGLHTELKKFFRAENECFIICRSIIEEENNIRNNPGKAEYLLDKYRREAYKRLSSTIMLITDDIIEMLKNITPAYNRYKMFASEEAFAAEEFHKHNIPDMDHLCLIELQEKGEEFTNEQYALFGKAPDTIRKVNRVISFFDEVLPENFQKKKLGEYQYMFCMWAAPNNIKAINNYFLAHYHGQYKLRQYAGVSKHSKDYNKNSPAVTEFIRRINIKLASEYENYQDEAIIK